MRRSTTHLVPLVLLCVACFLVLCSCGSYSPVGSGADVISDGLPEGAHVRIHQVDGTVIDDIFVRAGKGRLECRSQSFDIESIAYVEHRRPSPLDAVLVVLGGLAALAGLGLLTWAIVH